MSKKVKKNKKTVRTTQKMDKWIMHYVSDSACDMCGSNHKKYFKEGLSNIHTHGMREMYNHPEFQIVLDIDPSAASYLLNGFCQLVKDGRRFKAGDIVSGVGLCDISLFEATDNGKKVLRIIIPDTSYRLPDDKDCDFPYNLQYLSTKNLMVK